MRKPIGMYVSLLTMILLIHRTGNSQPDVGLKSQPCTLSRFLTSVAKGNLGYTAEKFNVSIAEAEYNASKVFPDPELSFVYSNNEDHRLQMGQSLETSLSYPVSFGKKRNTLMSLTRSEYELSQIVLDAYFQNLRAKAALSYFDALKNYRIYLLQLDIQNLMDKLAETDSIRFAVGDISEIDAMQSCQDARIQKSEVRQSLAYYRNSLVNLQLLQGDVTKDTLIHPADDFPHPERTFLLHDLLEKAKENRMDLLIAAKNNEISKKELKLLEAARAFEFNLESGYSFNSVVKNEIAPAPSFIGLSFGMAFPLKFSNLNKGTLEAAKTNITRNETLFREIENQVCAEVIQAFNDFNSHKEILSEFEKGLIDDAEKILTGKITSYQRGESGLIEVINARQSYTRLRLDYIETLNRYTTSLIGLELMTGFWDL